MQDIRLFEGRPPELLVRQSGDRREVAPQTKRLSVLLINAPFGLIQFPHLGTSLLKAVTEQAGFPCDVLYASIEFAKIIGFYEYITIQRADCPLLLPERPFARALSENIPSMDSYYNDIVEPFSDGFGGLVYRRDTRRERESMKTVEQQAGAFVEEFVSRPSLAKYDVMGFSTSFGQNVASLALAKRIKERHPDKIIVFGGANCEGNMGKQILRSFRFVDYAFSGDGDVSLPLFLTALADGAEVELPGVFAQGSRLDMREDVRPLTREEMDGMPYPDFSDFFDAIAATPEGRDYVLGIPIEGSRGCWWGEKHQCRFCGLNGLTMKYRSKSPERFRNELEHLVNRYGQKHVMATDNVLDRNYIKRLVPLLKEKRAHEVLFFEVRADFKKAELQALSEVGIHHLQAGIESLSTHVLKLMNKGVTALGNVQLLKWAEEMRVTLLWHIICGFPGETPQDYTDIAGLMQKIPHLQPPKAFAQLSTDRFSPYFNDPERFGIEIHPSLAYSYVYDLPEDDFQNLAYWFYYVGENCSTRISMGPPEYARPAFRVRRIWESLYGSVRFCYRVDDRGMVELEDTRPIALAEHVRLNELESAVFRCADKCVSPSSVQRFLRSREAFRKITPDETKGVLQDLAQRLILHREGNRYLALATTANCGKKLPAIAEAGVLSL